MDELARRYLKQQVELGGGEVVLDGPTGGVTAPRVARAAAPGGEPLTPAPNAPAPAARTAAPPPSAAPTVSAPAARRAPAPPMRQPVPPPELDEPPPPDHPDPVEPRFERPAGGSVSREARKAAAPKDWRVGAPPIPEPGLTIAPAEIDPATPEWDSLEAVAATIAGCTACFLARGRTNVVPGEGNPRAELMLVGEGPGETEDRTGRPFVGRAGELLTAMIGAIGYAREQVFICNVVKCRPPQNRKPLPDEMAACSRFLEAQIRLVKPKVILALGGTAAEALLQSKRSLGDLRLKVHSYRGTPLVVTYHPAALLRNPNWKKPAWDDVRIARQLADR